MFANFRQNEDAVSPIVATLVLIVVAVVGAVAVGTIMGTFSNDVGSKVSSDDVAGAVGPSGEILIAGSTTVQPVSELLAKAFMADHAGTRITVQGGGSGAGITSAKMGLVSIGAASKAVDDPELEVTQIGGSAVVVIAHKDFTASTVTKTELYDFITNGTKAGNLANADKFVQRAEESGTEETFAQWVTDKAKKSLDEYTTESANGNAGVLAAVKSHANYIGFVDAGYALNDANVKVLKIDGYSDTTSKNVLQALKDDKAGKTSTAYPNGLTRPLNYMTKGTPSKTVQSFIDFARSPGAIELFHEAGMYSILEFS